MAQNKEALALVVDIGTGMSEAAPGYDSPLQIASDILQMIVQRKMFQESKDELALILYGADESNNDLADEDNYRNINVVFPLSPANWHLFEEIQKIKPSNNPADLVDAIVVAADHLRRETEGKHGFAAKRVMLFSNAATTFNDHSLKTILDSLRRQDIIVDAIGPTWGQQDEEEDDNEENNHPGAPMDMNGHANGDENSDANRPTTNGHQQRTPKKPLTHQQQTGIRVIGEIVNTTDGTLFTFREALTILSVHQAKLVKPTATKYIMQLADLKLHICTYIQVKDNKPAIFRLKKVYARDPTTEIKVDRGRYTKDEQDQEIEKEELTDGFRYGTTFVPINKETLDEMKYQSEKCFAIIAFSDANMMRRSLYLGDTVYEVISEPGFEEEAQAFAGLVQAMYETNTVAIVRKCFSERSAPEIGFLRPHIAHDHICMYYIKLPFAEDLREFEFDNLNITKRNQPNEEQLKCIDNLITTMDLTHADRGGEEAFRPEVVFNPYVQRMFQSIARRAVTPDEPLSLSNTIMEMNDTLLRSVASKSKRVLNTIYEKFGLRDTDRRQKITTGDALFGNVDSSTKRRLDENENVEEPTADSTTAPADSGSFESQAAAKKKAALRNVGTLTPVEDFKLLIEQGSPSFSEVSKQMCNIILELVHNSHGDALFEKAFQCLQCLRETCINKLEPKVFNDLEILLKRQASTMDGRKDFWQKIIDEKFSLITSEECVESNVIPVEANKFLEEEAPVENINNAGTTNEQDGDDEDLFDLI
ncbi:unnamed protein product [Rotaria magnacalcarata]|uniref:VWFA domain-containing protein n=3 Tax=Rotaria magnacalcarata TaxID=392030 RepID=A0A814LHJ5_9BILA|nr:unnamed protein product [Rotaria magnacalcarata]CAF1627167.1 unnamed protein product [Rotaria magnacalcarata]CAF2060948.1 unnamed protein product [Rotaria magnacalcarata]CAF3797307.1 unnamed protein product [Rotaria magnacalcarata]